MTNHYDTRASDKALGRNEVDNDAEGQPKVC